MSEAASVSHPLPACPLEPPLPGLPEEPAAGSEPTSVFGALGSWPGTVP